MESWYKIFCPKCKEANWVCNGDESDVTGVDLESVECFKCGHKFWVYENYWFDVGKYQYMSYLEGDEEAGEKPMTEQEILEQISQCEKGLQSP